MRIQLSATKRPIVWADRSDEVLSQRITDEVVRPQGELRQKRIIVGHEPMDISQPPRAAHLISTTASVQDYVDVPNSLSFIR
jgi:hypothetical protein